MSFSTIMKKYNILDIPYLNCIVPPQAYALTCTIINNSTANLSPKFIWCFFLNLRAYLRQCGNIFVLNKANQRSFLTCRSEETHLRYFLFMQHEFSHLDFKCTLSKQLQLFDISLVCIKWIKNQSCFTVWCYGPQAHTMGHFKPMIILTFSVQSNFVWDVIQTQFSPLSQQWLIQVSWS